MSRALSSVRNDWKRAAAARAVDEIENGMVVGLGSGTTASFAVESLALRLAKGLRIVAIPTSGATAVLARRLGVPLTSFRQHRRIDIAIDGADQVARGTLDLIKGLGGALLREKIVATASDRMIIVIDETKLVDRLGGETPVPLEIVSFGWQTVLDRLIAENFQPRPRRAGARLFTTDNGNHVVDCAIPFIEDPRALQDRLASFTGVVETGLFVGMASKVVVGRQEGVDVLER